MATTARRRKGVAVRLNEHELALLQAAAEREGSKPTDLLRYWIRQAGEGEQAARVA